MYDQSHWPNYVFYLLRHRSKQSFTVLCAFSLVYNQSSKDRQFRHPKPLQDFRCLGYIHSATSATHLFLELLNPKVNGSVRGAVRSVPVDGLLGVVAIAFNGEVVLVRMGEVALLVDAKVQHAGALGQSARVGPGQPDGENSLLDDVEVLEAGGSGGLGGEGDSASVRGRVDCFDFVRRKLERIRESKRDKWRAYRWQSRWWWCFRRHRGILEI
jgi:hypothetical protein